MLLLNILTGIALLIAGRHVFWLLVAFLGVATGLNLVVPLLGGADDMVTLVVVLLAGIGGALLALFLQKLAVGVAGFLAGGYLAVLLFPHLNLAGSWELLFWLGGGILGAMLMAVFFEYALIVLSSLAGAMLIIPLAGLAPGMEAIATMCLAMLGIAVQSNASGSGSRRHRPRHA